MKVLGIMLLVFHSKYLTVGDLIDADAIAHIENSLSLHRRLLNAF